MLTNDRILAGDDQPDNLMIYQGDVLGSDYTLRCVDSGEQALRIAPKFRPNLVLMDMMMPGLNGTRDLQSVSSKSRLDHREDRNGIRARQSPGPIVCL